MSHRKTAADRKASPMETIPGARPTRRSALTPAQKALARRRKRLGLTRIPGNWR